MQLNMSLQKARDRLEKFGARYSDKVKRNGKICRGYIGVKLVESNDSDSELED